MLNILELSNQQNGNLILPFSLSRKGIQNSDVINIIIRLNRNLKQEELEKCFIECDYDSNLSEDFTKPIILEDKLPYNIKYIEHAYYDIKYIVTNSFYI